MLRWQLSINLLSIYLSVYLSACYQFIDVTATDKGYVTSPGYPKQYGNNIHCEFALHADPAHGIALTIEEFQLEPSPTCHHDYVTVSTQGFDFSVFNRKPFFF